MYVGDYVRFLDSTDAGIIVEVKDDEYLVIKNNDGFNIKAHKSEIVIGATDSLKEIEVSEEVKLKEVSPLLRNSRRSSVETIDIHIDKICEDYRTLLFEEIFLKQLFYFRRKLEKAIIRKTKKLIVIHGKGSGVLKNRIFEEIKRYDNVAINNKDLMDSSDNEGITVLSIN